MTTDELRLLETVSLPFEAEHMQQLLEAEGIQSFIEGINGSQAFTMNPLMGRIRIKVREEDLPRARQALSDSHNRVGQAWYCGACQEINEPSFDICWKCGGERSEVAATPPASPPSPRPEVRPEDLLSQHPVTKQYNPDPYAPPNSELSVPVVEPESLAVDPEYEDAIQRAYRASVLGLITLPVILHIYSFITLLGVLSIPSGSTAQLRSRFRTSMLIDLLVFFVTGCICAGLWLG